MKTLFITAALISIFTLRAQAQMPKCDADQAQFCKEKTDFNDVTSCLVAHDKEVSVDCKQELDRYITARRQAGTRGGGALSSFGGLNAMGPPLPLISYDGRYSPGAVSFTENKAGLSLPIYHSKVDVVSVSLAGAGFHFGDQVVLDNGIRIPQNLTRVESGANYFAQLEDKKNWSLRASLGYAGDQPFMKTNDLTYSLSGTYGFPGSGKAYWLASIYFSNNGPLGNYIPIPGIDYIYKSDQFSGIFGFPITAMQWTPVFPWTFSLAFFGPTIQLEAARGSIDDFQIYSGFYWNRQNYILASRVNDTDRLTIEEKKLALGFRTPVLGKLLCDFQVGEAFDRSVHIGSGLFKNDGGFASIASDLDVQASIKFKF